MTSGNSPFFDEKLSVPEVEQLVLDFWRREKVFKRSVEKVAPQGTYVFYDGPPFATGLPHYGHLLASTIKDAVPRYWTMRGYQVPRRWGWDCHGLPIETIVEKKLGISGRKEIEKVGIEKFNETAREQVLAYVNGWRKTVERIGRWVDFEGSYKTMDNDYIESVWWALGEMHKKGLLYEGTRVLTYCPRCETPIAQSEIAMDNSYKEVTEPAVYVKFKLKPKQGIGDLVADDKTYVLSWTTTPWTLPGNVALAVGRDMEYVFLESKGVVSTFDVYEGTKRVEYSPPETEPGFYIFAKDIPGIWSNVGHGLMSPDQVRQFEEYQKGKRKLGDVEGVVAILKGKELIGLEYDPLFDIPGLRNKNSHKIYAADFVTTDEGTGVVHTAVMYGEDDHKLGVEVGLPQYHTVDRTGHFTDEVPAGLAERYVKDRETDKKIFDYLEKKGYLLAVEDYTHAYPHCYRCEAPILYYAVPAWFVRIQGDVKKKLLRLNEKIHWVPEHLKEGRFKHILEGAPDWNISRNRYWASPLPIWKCEACERFVVVSSRAELEKLSGDERVRAIDLHRPYVDEVTIRCECGGTMHRTPEVFDCWFESGSMPFAAGHYPFENKAWFKQHFPSQFVAEYIAQTRTWFYYMLVVSGVLFDEIPFENVVTTGTVLAEDGQKLSKSKRNFPDPLELVGRYGADALRLYLLGSPVMRSEDMNFSEKGVDEVFKKVILRFVNVYAFYALYADAEFDVSIHEKSGHVLDQWILSRLHCVIGTVTAWMNAYEVDKAVRPIGEFVDDLSTWYVRRSRGRFRGDDMQDKEYALSTLRHVLVEFSKVLAPFAPFIAEAVYDGASSKSKSANRTESVHLEQWPEVSRDKIDMKLDEVMQEVRQIASAALAKRAEAGVRVRQPLRTLQIRNPKSETRNNGGGVVQLLKDEVNVKEVKFGAKIEGEVELDTKITPELKEEGIVREVVRAVQGLRQKAGLTPQDTARLFVKGDEDMVAALRKYEEEVKKVARMSGVRYGKDSTVAASAEISVDGAVLWVGIAK